MNKMRIYGQIFLFAIIPIAFCQRQLIFIYQIISNGVDVPSFIPPTFNRNLWKYNSTELTPVGMRQQYIFGLYNNEYYMKNQSLLNQTYNSDEIYIRSINYPSSISSAKAHMLGIYGYSKSSLSFNEIKNAIPPIVLTIDPQIIIKMENDSMPYSQYRVPIFVYNSSNDSFSIEHCPFAKNKNIELFVNSPEVLQFIQSNQFEINYTIKSYGLDPADFPFPKNLPLLYAIKHCILVEKNCRLENSIQERILNSIIPKLMKLNYTIDRYYTRLGSSSMISEILNSIQEAINSNMNNSKDYKKAYFAFSKEEALIYLLNTLNLLNINLSNFSSSLIFEVYSENPKSQNISDYKVTLKYNMESIPLFNCELNICNMDVFRSKMSQLIVENNIDECWQIPINEVK